MGEVITHPSWAERIAFFEAELGGRWDWRMKTDTAAVLTDPDGNVRCSALPDHAPGIVAALNTVEGRAAYGRARLDHGDHAS